MSTPRPAPSRLQKQLPILIGSGALLGISVLLHFFNPVDFAFYPRCGFNKVTGLHCPGCGGLRATHQLLQGNIREAASMNLLMFILAPILAWYGVQGLRGKVQGIPSRMSYTLLGLVVLFWVIRNIPVEPFTLLLPM